LIISVNILTFSIWLVVEMTSGRYIYWKQSYSVSSSVLDVWHCACDVVTRWRKHWRSRKGWRTSTPTSHLKRNKKEMMPLRKVCVYAAGSVRH